MKLLLALPAALALLLPPGALAEAPTSSPDGDIVVKPSGTPGKAAGARTLSVSATIYKVDAKTRIVQLQNEYGGYQTIKVGPSIGSLEGFAPGDRVTVELRQGVALEFQPPGSEFVAPTESEARVASTEKGTVAAVEGGMRSTVTISRIDAKTRVVTFEGPGGNVYQVKASPQVKLDQVKVGDKLIATYTETVALKLEKARAKAK